MNKLLITIVMLLCIQVFFALDIDYSGELRTRGLIYNGLEGKYNDYIDDRLQFKLMPKLNDDLSFAWNIQVDNLI